MSRLLACLVLLSLLAWAFCLGPAETALAQSGPETIKITARKFEYAPAEINLSLGKPVILELTSLDRTHGFNCPGLNLRTDIEPGKTAKIEFTPDKAGSFPFFCDIFCGSGHDDMSGVINVKP